MNGLPKSYHVTQWCGDTSVDWIKQQRPKDQPFFLWISFVKPHVPYDCPEHLRNLYSIENLEKPWLSEQDGTHKNPVFMNTRRNNEFHLYSEEANLLARANYYANISFIDEQVGRIFQTIREEDLSDNTLVLFASDHGDMLGDHGLWYKGFGYEGSLHIPMLAWWPRVIKPKTRCKDVVSLLDIFPTFTECAGITCKQKRPGTNLLSLLTDSHSLAKEICVSEFGFPPNYMLHVRSKEWKYMFYQKGGYEELYYLCTDPNELKNLADDASYYKVKTELKDAAVVWIKEYGNAKLVLDEEDAFRVVSIQDAEEESHSMNPRPFSRMPWDSRVPPWILQGKDKRTWFWECMRGDWSKILIAAKNQDYNKV